LNQNPILAIPFTDNSTLTNDALLVAYPGLRTGLIQYFCSSRVVGNDLYGRIRLPRSGTAGSISSGWHYNRIADGIDIRSSSTVTEVAWQHSQ
jgi:hypothetical protein